MKITYPHHHSPHRGKVYLLPLEGVKGVEPSLWEGLGRLLLILKRLDLILVSKEEVDVVIGIHQTVLLVRVDLEVL